MLLTAKNIFSLLMYFIFVTIYIVSSMEQDIIAVYYRFTGKLIQPLCYYSPRPRIYMGTWKQLHFLSKISFI